jgi:predicted AlkP superfamily pyrophosphatase or phosphodiesterase
MPPHSSDSAATSEDHEEPALRTRTRDDSDNETPDEDVFEDDYEESGLMGVFDKRRGKQGEDIPLQEKGPRRPSRRHRERQKRGETEHELIYNIEEGGQASQSPSRKPSEENLRHYAPPAKRKNRLRRAGLHVAIIAFFLILLYGAYAATRSNRQAQQRLKLPLTLSNGTSLFAPTTILISLDGFRADFLQRGLTPTLNQFIREGVSPLYMMPSFPSVTFPNHYTMVTGLYPEAHGIVGNSFWDPADESEFYYTKPQQSLQGKWWGGEPVWLTAELQGVRAAVHMWPGSEAAIGDVPTSHVDQYNGKEDLAIKVERILHFLDLPGPDSPSASLDNPRPQLIAAYVPNVDSDGHRYGPNSTQIRQTIRNVDEMLGEIFQGLKERNLTNVVNVVIVSDHGMATTSTHRVVQLEDLLDVDDIAHVDGWPLYGIRPKDSSKLQAMYDQLKEKTKRMPYLHIYLRDKDMPERYHFSSNPRIAPLWIVPDAGWAIAPKKEFDVQKAKKEGLVYHPRGLHGYDYENSLMRAIFVARGPAFPHPAGSRIDNFRKHILILT